MLSDGTALVLRSNNFPASKSSARRCLFGRSDHKKVSESLEKELKEIDHEKQQRWEFDFAEEKPLPGGGRFEWIPVDKTEYVPVPYIREYPAKPTKPRTTNEGLKRRLNFDDVEDNKSVGDENTSPVAPASSPVNSPVLFPSNAAKASRRVQARITAIFQKRKKQRTDKC